MVVATAVFKFGALTAYARTPERHRKADLGQRRANAEDPTTNGRAGRTRLRVEKRPAARGARESVNGSLRPVGSTLTSRGSMGTWRTAARGVFARHRPRALSSLARDDRDVAR